MEFKQYPTYKDSGVEWLGAIPKHWKQKPIWSLFQRVKRTGFPQELLLSVYRDYGVIPKDSRDDNHNRASEDLTPYQLVCPNDLVINKMKAWQGSIAISDLKGIVSPAYYIYQPRQAHYSKYIHFLIRSIYFIQSYKNFSKGIRVNQWDLDHEAFTHIHLLLPPLKEQQQIVSFLDAETTRIDNLIAKQEKLIELLEEQRKSIISHAVTKGLNPDAPMKDSGVEWLEEVPSHWRVKRLDSISKIIRGNSAFAKGDLLDVGQYVALQYGKTYKVNEIDSSFNSYVNQEFFKDSQIAEFEDVVLISTSETLEDLGHSCFYARHDFGLIGGEQFLLKPNDQAFGKYLYYATKAFSSYLQRYATGLKVFRFNLDDLKKIYIPDISLVDQQKIANFLDQETSRIDLLVLKQNELIQKLKEYRSSIISHAVTGKIDVREIAV
ncbi:MAG: restriction endonuclease subunit S [Alphaproteobacteria bacterium]